MSPAASRAEPVGSLLRPAALLEARREHAASRLDAAGFKRAEDAAVDRAIAVQQNARLDVVTDGEQRRSHFTGPLSEAVDDREAFIRIRRALSALADQPRPDGAVPWGSSGIDRWHLPGIRILYEVDDRKATVYVINVSSSP